MDLGFLSGLIGGQGKDNTLATLLPLLLGGKGNLAQMLGPLLKGSSRDGDKGFPPLFGEQNTAASGVQNGMLDFLGNMIKRNENKTNNEELKTEYPYELQYNRPFQP